MTRNFKTDSKERIVIFDFDGTITRSDTMLDLALKHFGLWKFILGLLVIFPKLLAYKLGLISNTTAKEAFLVYFYKGMSYSEFKEITSKYSLVEIDKILKKEAVEKINFYKSQNIRMLIISASVEEWVKPWAIKNGFEEALCSKLELENNLISGKLLGKNCYGSEKVSRFISSYGPLEKYYIISFGDSRGDKEILEKSDQSYYKKYQ